ncbi:MAG: hypothetical protein ABEJ44_04075 [Halanaeroarchaeum sp.]
MRIGPEPFNDSDDEEDEEHALPPEPVRRRFWVIVVLLNLGIFAVSLGAMIAAFRGQYRDAALLIGGGAVVLYSAYRRYRTRHEAFEDAT